MFALASDTRCLRTPPAVAAGLASRPWSLAELVAAALAEVENDPTPDRGRGGEVEGAGPTVDALAMLGALAANDNGAARPWPVDAAGRAALDGRRS